MNTTTSSTAAPLSGIKILDLTRLLPGPLCGQYLADLGAEVIKVEDTGAGDYARPALRELVNRGKKSLSVNLKTEQGKEIFLRLVDESDIVLESFRPGTMHRLGLGYEHLSMLNPQLVYCAISGFGQSGAYSQKAGHDINFQALTGILSQTGTTDTPVIPGFLLADLAGGTLSAATGIMAALLEAQRTGKGCQVDVAMTDSLMALSALPVASLNEKAQPTARGMGTHTGGTAHYNIYETLDGRHLAVGAQEKKFWDDFCDAIECSHLKHRHSQDVSRNSELKAEVTCAIRTRTLDEWMRVFSGLDCCVSPVRTIDEAVCDPYFSSRGVIKQAHGKYQIGLPFSLSGLSIDFERQSPSHGEHTQEILASLGYDRQATQDLLQAGVVLAGKD